MDWHALIGIQRNGVLIVVFLIGTTLALPYRSPLYFGKAENDTSASTVEVLRNIQKILNIASRPIRTNQHKFAKQATAAATAGAEDSEGAANALAYLTDSFGGQLAGQILSVILSSVTGDVRGILGGSLNLFQTDDRRDRVQFFLDEISQNFLKITGLNQLTTMKPPTGQQTGIPGILGNGAGATALQHAVKQQQQRFPIASLGPSAGGGIGNNQLVGLGANNFIGNNNLVRAPISTLGVAQLQKPQQGIGSAANQPIIYVLPSLSQQQASSGLSSGVSSGASSGTTATKVATAATANKADEDSEEDI